MARENTIKIFRKFGLDLFLLCVFALCLHLLNAVGEQFKRGFFCGDESLMYPYKADTISTPLLRLYGLALPILAMLICEVMLFKNDDEKHKVYNFCIPAWLKAFYYPVASFGFGACFIELTTNISKFVIGRPRPHFFDICKPSIDCSSPDWQYRYIQPHEYTCTGDQIDKIPDLYLSFVSGHSTWSAFTMIYLALYLEKRMVWSGTRALRHSLQFSAVMLSWFTALSRVSDYKHHWSDVLAGYILGATFAVIIWNYATDILEPKVRSKPVQNEPTSINNIQMALPA